ncbi:hypothetical protein DFH28DRAFT_929091 [Melampsora americana]|nr:hypothetical protein DFH28DRAFT_929091 [Melampsora americana]
MRKAGRNIGPGNTQSQGNKAAQGMQTLETKVHPKTYGVPRQTCAPDVTEVRAIGGKESKSTQDAEATQELSQGQWVAPRVEWRSSEYCPEHSGSKKKEGPRQRRSQEYVGAKDKQAKAYKGRAKTKEDQRQRRAQGSTRLNSR